MLRNLRLLKVIVVLLVISTCSWLAGCAMLDQLWSLKQKEKNQKEVQDLPPEPAQLVTVPAKPLGRTKVDLYFADPSGKGLVSERREIPKVEGIARATIEELIKGPSKQSGLLPTIPKGTGLLDINVRPDGLCIVNFSQEFVANHTKGSLSEALTVYSVVNTLTQFPTVQKVKFLVDGQERDTLAGHLDISTAMARDEKLIKQK